MIKKKYHRYGVYIYECPGCGQPALLHLDECQWCASVNVYKDTKSKISGALNTAVQEELFSLLNGEDKPDEEAKMEREEKTEMMEVVQQNIE